jgi:hypothetical protein
MNWKQNKTIFSHIIDKKYMIKKDINTNDILYINWSQFEMKCKYFLAFTVNEFNNIIWSCDNSFIDQKTKYFSQCIKSNLGIETKIFTQQILNDLKKMIQNGMGFVYGEDKINIIWCLVGEYKKYKNFYVITEIIYL